VPLGDGDLKDKDLCSYPIALGTGKIIPRCLDMITAGDVIRAIERYLEFERSAGAG
jgi:hypothetical protein